MLFLIMNWYIGSGINAKATMFYVSDYITKGNASLSNIVTVCAGALEKYVAVQNTSAMVCGVVVFFFFLS